MVTIVIQFNYTFQYISIYIRIHFSYSIQLYISDNMLEKWWYLWRLYLKTIPLCHILPYDEVLCAMWYEWTWLDQRHASVPRDLTWHYSLSWGEDQRASMQDSMLIWRRIFIICIQNLTWHKCSLWLRIKVKVCGIVCWTVWVSAPCKCFFLGSESNMAPLSRSKIKYAG